MFNLLSDMCIINIRWTGFDVSISTMRTYLLNAPSYVCYLTLEISLNVSLLSNMYIADSRDAELWSNLLEMIINSILSFLFRTCDKKYDVCILSGIVRVDTSGKYGHLPTCVLANKLFPCNIMA